MNTYNEDCGCLLTIHTGPHWLHLDYLDAQNNLQFLERAIAAAEAGKATDVMFLLFAYSQAEAIRLKEKLQQMHMHHVECVSYTELGNGATNDLPAKERALKARLNEAIATHRPAATAINMARPRSQQLSLFEESAGVA